MRKIFIKPKYDGYKVKCGTCKCEFFAALGDIDTFGYDDIEYVMCPTCNKRILRSLFWKKCKEGESK